jgi:hypothetical protein
MTKPTSVEFIFYNDYGTFMCKNRMSASLFLIKIYWNIICLFHLRMLQQSDSDVQIHCRFYFALL